MYVGIAILILRILQLVLLKPSLLSTGHAFASVRVLVVNHIGVDGHAGFVFSAVGGIHFGHSDLVDELQ
jgi:hypothetical protein